MFKSGILLGMLLLAVSPLTAAPDLTEDHLTFDYLPSENFALALRGGSVQGVFTRKTGSVTLVKGANNDAMLDWRNPGTDTLEFPVSGNLPSLEGTIIFTHAYRYDSTRLLPALKAKKQWSQSFFLFRTTINSGGIGFFHEVNTSMNPAHVRLTLMVSFGPHQWQYIGATLNQRDLPPGHFFDAGFSWKDREIALLINNKIVHREKLKAALAWGTTFMLGDCGSNAFDGQLKQVKVYDCATF